MTTGTVIPSHVRFITRSAFASGVTSADDPFGNLLSGGHPLRAYWARLELDGRVVVPCFAVVMEPNEYPGSRAAGARAPSSNPQLDQIWQVGYRRHRDTSARAVASLERRALPAATDDAPRHAPLTWCRRTDAYATPLCPSCLTPLATCRDEVLLRKSGLPSYEGSLVRFLYCGPCAAGRQGERTFYTYSLRERPSLAEGVRLRRRSELYRDLGTRISTGDAGAPEAAAARHFPCFTCEHRAACYPAQRGVDERVPAEELLLPIAYYEFHWLPLEPLPLDYQETAALLGGGSVGDLTRGKSVAGADVPVREAVLASLGSEPAQFFFRGDRAGLFALEVLYLKLTAMAELARGVGEVLERTGFPHLSLTPDRLRGRFESPGAAVPARWGLTLTIADLLTTAPLVELAADRVDGESPVGCVPHPCAEAYLPAGMCQRQVETLWMRMSGVSLSSAAAGAETVVVLACQLSAPDLYVAEGHGRHDTVRVTVAVGPSGEHRVVFSGRKVGAAGGGFMFRGTSGPLAPAVRAVLASEPPPDSSSVEVTLAHAYAAPADVVSLGVVMLRLLLANDGQDLTQLDARMAADLAERVAGEGAARADGGRDCLTTHFAAAKIAIEPVAVLYRQADRAEGGAAVPAALWQDSLLQALRMVSNLPGWSVCGAADEWDEADPARPLRTVAQELEDLAARARASLLGSAGRNACLQEVCDDFLADLRAAGLAGDDRGPSDLTEQTIMFQPKAPPK